MGTTLDKLTASLTADTPEISASQLATAMLKDLRAHANNRDNASVRFWARLIIELGKASAQPVDLMTATPDKINLSMLQASLWTRRMVGDFYAASNQLKSIGRLKDPNSDLDFLAVGRGRKSYSSAFQLASYAANECQLTENEALIMDAAAFGMSAGHDAVFDLIKEAYHHSPGGKVLEKLGNRIVIANVILAWLKLVAAVTTIKGEIEVEGSLPMPRTLNSTPGEKRLMKATFRSEVGRKQMLNCVRLALVASTGLDFSMPTDGPLAEKAVEWHFAEDYDYHLPGLNEPIAANLIKSNSEKFVSFETLGKNKNPADQVTDEEGVSEMYIVGAPKIPAVVYQRKSREVAKEAKIGVSITLKSAKDVRQNVIDILGTAGNVTVSGPLALLIAIPEIGFRLPYLKAFATVPVTDHEPCEGQWSGTVTFTKVNTSSGKKTIIPHKSPMAITEGGGDDVEKSETYSGTISVSDKGANTKGNFHGRGTGTTNYDIVSTVIENVYGKVWCSPLQGFKPKNDGENTVMYGSGSGSGSVDVSVSIDADGYTISFTPPDANVSFTSSTEPTSFNSCDKSDNTHKGYSSNGTDRKGPGTLSSGKMHFGSDPTVLSDSSTITLQFPTASSSSETSHSTSTASTVTTITWNLRRCD